MSSFEISYAGTALTVPTAEALAWIEAQLGSAGLRPPGPPGWPATKLAGLSSFGWPARFRCRVGSLYWPRGISRFAIGHFLASTDQLNDIYAAMPAGEAATLVLDTGDGRGKVSTSMSMLPARPLANFEGYSDTKGLYLLTLVDARYWLWGKWTTDAVTVTDDTTPWGDMVAAAALDLGITLTHDTVSTTGWGYAPNGLDLAGEPAPLVLDAVCYACGLRVARKLDGSYEARNCDTDRTNVRTNLGGLAGVRISGGAFSLDRGDLPPGIDTVDDQPLALPETVRLVVLADDGLHTADKPLKPLDPLFEAVRTGAVRAWAVNWATYDATAAGAYVGALGRAEGIRALAAVSRRFAGVVPWAPEGVSEAVEWVYRTEDACTVIHPAAWSDGVTEVVGIGGCACTDPGAGFVEQADKCNLLFREEDCAGGTRTITETAVCLGTPAKSIKVKVTSSELEAAPVYVSYVGLMPPAGISVTPPAITDAGTFVETWDDQPANKIFKGPTTGADAPPTFDFLVTADIPDHIVTLAKLAQAAAHTFLGNPTGTTADRQDCTLGATLAFSGTALQTGAGTGHVTWSANSFATTIASGVVTLAMWSSGVLDTDGTLAANSDSKVPSQKAVRTLVENAVTGLLDLKGGTDCSANPNYPAALKGDAYVVTVAGKIGGASGVVVEVGDTFFASADNAGGTQASVGSSWDVLQYNVVAAALTKADDTNVTLTLGGTPATALLMPVSITAGWAGLLASSRGGTGNGFTKFSGPASSEKTFTLPNASAVVLTDNAAVTVAQGGTGQITAAAAFNALSPLTTLGDLLYGGASGAGTRLAGNTAASMKLLTQTGAAGVSAVPTWELISAVLDALFGSTQGTIAYRGASAWGGLGPGTAGQALISGGAGANPAWKTASVGGSPVYTGTYDCAGNESGTISGMTIVWT